jgi:hypothetical protein
MSNTPRSFKIVAVSQNDNVNFENGIYHGSRPGQAALKAFNWYCRKAGINAACKRRFTIEERTGGKTHKEFHYVGSRKQLHPPQEIERGGKTYFINYESKVRKAK